jgi:hypothetical protein
MVVHTPMLEAWLRMVEVVEQALLARGDQEEQVA